MIYNWYINTLLKFRGTERPRSKMKQRFGGFMLSYAPGLMNCREFDKSLPHFLENELTPKKERAFHSHKLLCPFCKAHFKTLTASMATTEKVFETIRMNTPDMPSELMADVVSSLQKVCAPAE